MDILCLLIWPPLLRWAAGTALSKGNASLADEAFGLVVGVGAFYDVLTTLGLGLAEVTALIGDPARANMLAALMDGRALTATELAYVAGVGASTASAHLAKLHDANLLSVVKQGRHRYFRLASPLVSRMIEGIMTFAAIGSPPRYRPRSTNDTAMRLARTCYDHLAGRLGVALADALVAHGHVVLGDDAGELTTAGILALDKLGIAKDALRHSHKRVFCRPCLDWSERRPHLAGTIGAALATHCFDHHWIEHIRDSRAVRITPAGRAGLRSAFDMELG
jgi:DNA-binding transcriptional ArsR family regulator